MTEEIFWVNSCCFYSYSDAFRYAKKIGVKRISKITMFLFMEQVTDEWHETIHIG